MLTLSPPSRRSSLIALAALGLLGCGVPPASSLGEDAAFAIRRAGLGEEIEPGTPSHQERVILYLTNRARSEPDKFNPEEPYPPTPPVRYDLQLSKAARFHAEQIAEADCWCEDHSSCCDLVGEGEETTCSSPPTGCGGTDAATRVSKWSPSYSAENMARDYPSGASAVDGWIHSSGHWQNMNADHSMLGVGQYEARAWVQDFGRGGPLPPVIGDGVHFQDAGATRFGITYYQPGTGGPQSILLILDGECVDLDLAAGEPDHGAFEVTRQPTSGCHRYYFYVRDGNGQDHVYPEEGSLGVAIGNADGCPLYDTNRPADTCSPAGQGCMTGDTRPCYTGPFGTRDVGACAAGVERCIGGQWTGECRLEVLPSAQDTCQDAIDNDCDGVVDEECVDEDDAGMEPAPDMNVGGEAMDGAGDGEAPGGCSVARQRGTGGKAPLLLLALLLGFRWRRVSANECDKG